MKRTFLIIALCICAFGCRVKPQDAGGLMANQSKASDSGSVSIPEVNRNAFLKSITLVTKAYGLSENRNSEVETLVNHYENRGMYDAFFCKGEVCGFVLSDDSSRNRFGFQFFSEPFSGAEYAKFRTDTMAVIAKYQQPGPPAQ